MNEARIIPCMDIKAGRIVKGVGFKDVQDAGDPVEAAVRYEQEDADEIWILDIAATVDNRSIQLDLLAQVAKNCKVPICAGGGIRTLHDAEMAAQAGAAKVGIGSAAQTNPELIRRVSYRLGKAATVALVDVVARPDGRFEVLGPGQIPTGIQMVDWLRELERQGAGEILLTSMQDGTRAGYDIAATRAAADAVAIPIIASGGAGKLEDFSEAVIKGGATGLLAASVFHFGELTIGQVKDHLRLAGVRVMGDGVDISEIRFDEKGLVPAIVQDMSTGLVLMQAYMNAESLQETLRTGIATFFSRSRQQLWRKGETSGNIQNVREILYDCDGDCLLLKVDPAGPACHTGEMSCFYRSLQTMDGGRSSARSSGILMDLYKTIAERKNNPVEGSYTNKLLDGGVNKIGKKVIEEAGEVVLAAKDDSFADVRFEAADLLYHLMVLLAQQGVSPEDVYAELANRHR